MNCGAAWVQRCGRRGTRSWPEGRERTDRPELKHPIERWQLLPSRGWSVPCLKNHSSPDRTTLAANPSAPCLFPSAAWTSLKPHPSNRTTSELRNCWTAGKKLASGHGLRQTPPPSTPHAHEGHL